MNVGSMLLPGPEVILACPLIALLPIDPIKYLFPSLGDAENTLRILSVLIALIVTVPMYLMKERAFFNSKRGRSNFVWAIFICGFVGLVVYGILTFAFVRHVPIPTGPEGHEEWIASVGYKRTSFAKTHFGQLSDWEMLRKRGLEEEQIWQLWSKRSILIVRGSLWISYMLVLTSFTGAISFVVLCDKSGPAPNP